MNNYVYKITNKNNNMWYIGSRCSKNLSPENDLGGIYFSSSSNKTFINELIENKNNFIYEILAKFETREEANEFESTTLKSLKANSDNLSYNMTNSWPIKSYKHQHSEETKRKIGKKHKNKKLSIAQKLILSSNATKVVCCLECKKEINYGNFKRWHFNSKCNVKNSFKTACCLKCKKEIGINNIKSHCNKCYDNISEKNINKQCCLECKKEISIYAISIHLKSHITFKLKPPVHNIKKSSCCLNCKREITNANIFRHLTKCYCPK